MTDNQFRRLAALGYARLVPIIPPDATISERSTLYSRVGTKQDGRGKTPGIRWADKTWSGFDWIPYEADERDFHRWHAMGAGVGIKTGDGLVAIDADTADVDHARIIRDVVEEMFDLTPIRIGQFPKALYPLRVATAFPYSRIEFGPERIENDKAVGRIYRVEILSDKRQFVAHGVHPKTGQPYHWPVDLVPFDDLPIVSPQQLTKLLDTMRERLPDTGEIIREGGATSVSQASLAGKLDLVRKAVEAIPNTSELFPSRESYRDVGYAIKAALPDDEPEAFGLFQDWCDRWQEGENDPGVVRADWSRMKPPFRRGAPWLYDLAEQHGQGFSAADVWLENLDDPDNPFAKIDPGSKNEADIYEVLDLHAIRNRPPIEWLLERHIPRHSLGFLYSVPGAGKSFLMLDIAMHIADARVAWHSDKLNLQPDANVLYLASEGSYGFKNRVEAWIQRKGASPAISRRFKMIERTINFMKADDVAKLIRTVKNAFDGPVALVVVDTVSRALPGADENLQKDMSLFVEACGAVQRATGGAVVGVHHAGKNGDMRGSTVLLGAGDFVFGLERRKGASIGTLECVKQKDGPDGWSEPYRFETVELARGETSMIVERADVGIGPADALTPATVASVFDAMRTAWEAGEPWSNAPQAGERRAVRRLVTDFGFTAARAEEALGLWEASGFVSVDTVSSKSKRRGLRVVGRQGQDVLRGDIFG